jgi:hypothetical protein
MNRSRIQIGTLCLFAATSTAAAQETEALVLRGETMDVWPIENLAARGFQIQELPREQNAAWVYIEAINAYADLPNELRDAFDYTLKYRWPDGVPALEQYLAEPGNRKALELTRKAAAMKQCQMPYFGDPSQSVVAVLLPNLSHMRFLSKLLVVEGKRLEAMGRYQQAAELYGVVMDMGHHVAQGCTLIESLVGVAVRSLADRATLNMVLRHPLSKGDLKALLKLLDERALRLPTVEKGLIGESNFGPSMIDELCSRPLRVFTNLNGMFGDSPGWDMTDYQVNPVPQDGWGRLEKRVGQLIYPDRAIKRHMSGYYDNMLRSQSLPAGQAARNDFTEEQYINQAIPRWDVLSRAILPSLSRAIALGNRLKADAALARTATAIRLSSLLRKGEPPGSLDEIESILPVSAMIDPFSGERLLYRVEEPGWVLYSVGLNLSDDGGEEGERWEDLDMVVRFPPEPVEPFDSDQEDE